MTEEQKPADSGPPAKSPPPAGPPAKAPTAPPTNCNPTSAQQPPSQPPAQQKPPQQQQKAPPPPAKNPPAQADPNAKRELPPPPRPKRSGSNFKRSESLTEFAKALSRAQGEMDTASKDSLNPFHHAYYADMASVVGALRGPFSKNGLSFMQFPRCTDEGVEVETLILHDSGEWVSDVLGMPTMKIDPQGYGQAITYACRYAVRSMAGVAPEEDDANKPTADTQKARSDAIDTLTAAAKQGMEAFEAAFKLLPPETRKFVQRDLPGIRKQIPGTGGNGGNGSGATAPPARSASVI